MNPNIEELLEAHRSLQTCEALETDKEIAEDIGCSPVTVFRFRRKRGIHHAKRKYHAPHSATYEPNAISQLMSGWRA